MINSKGKGEALEKSNIKERNQIRKENKIK